MALPHIPGLYENITTVSGLMVGNTVANVRAANNLQLNWIKQIPTFVYNQNAAPMFRIPAGSQHERYAYSAGADFYKPVGAGNKLIAMVLNGTQTNGSKYCWINPYQFKNTRTGSTYIQNNGSGDSVIGSPKVILDSEPREHYIMLPIITARNEAGAAVNNVEYSNYMTNYAESHPYITTISARYYYKANFNTNSISSVNLGFTMAPMDVTVLYDPQDAGRPNYLGEYSVPATSVVSGTGGLVTNFSTVIFKAPLTQSIIHDSMYSTALYSDDGTHGAYQMYVGDISQNIAPFLFISPIQAKEIINSVGLWWGESSTEIQNEAKGYDTVSNKIHAPKVTAGGATTKDDYKGEEIKEHWQEPGYRVLGGISIVYTNNVTPDEPPDRSDEGETPDPIPDDSDTLNLDTPTFTGVGCFATYYYMSKSMLNVLNNELWTSDDDTITAIIEGLKFYGADPMQAIMSLRLYPFDLSSYVSSTSLEKIKLGRVQLQYASGYIISDNATCIIDLGQIYIKPSFYDFRDYSPYTQIQLYVPFIGFMRLNTNEFMNHMLKIQMVVDITTGSCEVCIYADSRPMAYQSGNIGVEIPITLNNMTQVSTAIMQGILTFGSEAILGSAEDILFHKGAPAAKVNNGAVKGDAGEEIMVDANLGQIGDIAAQVVVGASTTSQSGKSSPACNLSNPLFPYLIISRPTWEKPDNYEHTYGKVCHRSGLVSSFSGFTICRNVDTTGIICTEMEQNMIKSLLESGVYL